MSQSTGPYEEVYADELADRLRHAGGADFDLCRLFPSGTVAVSAIGFGDTEASLRAKGADQFAAHWGATQFEAHQVRRWTIPDALVHGPYGVVTVGNYVLADTTIHVPTHTPEYSKEAGRMRLPAPERVFEIDRGLHFASGGYYNYYHWTLDVLPKLQIAPFHDFRFDGVILTAPIVTAFQYASALLVGRLGYEFRQLGQGEAARVRELVLVPNMTACGPLPHPALADFFSSFAAAMPTRTIPRRRLYVSRGGGQNRPLVNAAALEALASSIGYDVCDPGQMSVADQISVFSSATHVVAPHGAGLANLVYCQPGTKVLEIGTENYENWCFRHLAAMKRLDYGLIVGSVEEEDRHLAWPHAQRWRAPLAEIEATLRAIA